MAKKLIPALALALLLACSPPAPLPKGGTSQKGSVSQKPSGQKSAPDPLSLTGTPVAEGQMEEVPAEVASLAKQLVQGQQGDRAKALALYEWVAKNIRYDMPAYLANDLPDPSPDVVLSSRLTVCEGYARLYMAMAHAVGLEAVMVAGNSKGFAPDEDKSEPDHAWNAVKIDGKWQLLDPTWGAGHISETKTFEAEYSQDWFSTPPEQFAATHLPEDPRWQLLNPAVSAESFWARPSLSNLYFDYGLSLESHDKGKIAMDGPLELRFASEKDCRLMASIYSESGPLPESYTLVERRGQDFTVSVVPPQDGKYRLVIFAGPPDSNRAESAVTYDLDVRSGNGGKVLPKTLQTFSDEEVRLVSPRSELQRGQSTELVIQAPGATKLMAVIGDEQIHFQQDGDRFTAEVLPEADKVTVFGSYDSSVNYSGLLEFPVIP